MPRAKLAKTIPRAHARTVFLRVPRKDFAKLATGHKRELRDIGQPGVPPLSLLSPPEPVIVWSPPTHYGGPRLLYELMVLEQAWQEPLGAISIESLAAEGFASRDEFRRYWKERYSRTRRRPWDPLRPVRVFSLRPWAGVDDEARFARMLLERLYLDPLAEARGEPVLRAVA